MIDAIGDALGAISPSWPLVVLILGILWIFRKHIPNLLGNIKRLKVFGFEIELQQNLAQLQKDAEQAAASSKPPTLGTPAGRTEGVEYQGGADQIYVVENTSAQKPDDMETVVTSILEEAAQDPKVALILLSIELEKELKIILGRAGFLAGQSYIPLPKAVQIIQSDYNVLSHPVVSAIQSFWRVRNQLIHGGEGDRDDVLSAIDSGLMVYKTLRHQPFARFYVLQCGVPVYANEAGTKVRDDVRAVVVEEVGAGGLTRHKHHMLTTRAHFKVGMEIAWEADNTKVLAAPLWWRDLDTGAMVGSDAYGPLDFVGRDIADFRKRA